MSAAATARRTWLRASLLLTAALLAGPALAGGAPWRVVRGQVEVVCPMTVGGRFEAKTHALTGALVVSESRPAVLTGELSVDLRTLETGIGLRDQHMRDEYLEVGRGAGYERAVLTDVRLADLDAHAAAGRTAFNGVLLLHGMRAPVSGRAEIRSQGATSRVEASFPVSLADYGIATPQYLGVGVKTEVLVKVTLEASPVAPIEVTR
jgi:polyisoprenoid-binding protein YceI